MTLQMWSTFLRMADIVELIYADYDWLRRQFFRRDDASRLKSSQRSGRC
jgi:hypothetical protein